MAGGIPGGPFPRNLPYNQIPCRHESISGFPMLDLFAQRPRPCSARYTLLEPSSLPKGERVELESLERYPTTRKAYLANYTIIGPGEPSRLIE